MMSALEMDRRIFENLREMSRASREIIAPGLDLPAIPEEHDDFGTLASGTQTVSDVQDLLNSGSDRIAALGKAYGAAAPTWVNQDPTAFTDWTNDWVALQQRWDAASSAANSVLTVAKINVFTPNSLMPAQAEYDGLLKALKQCAPPDGCPVSKGDLDDLDARLTAATKVTGTPAADYSQVRQPTTKDVGMDLYKTTAPVDVVAMATGEQKTKLPSLPSLMPKINAVTVASGVGVAAGFVAGAKLTGLLMAGVLGGLIVGTGVYVVAKRVGL